MFDFVIGFLIACDSSSNSLARPQYQRDELNFGSECLVLGFGKKKDANA